MEVSNETGVDKTLICVQCNKHYAAETKACPDCGSQLTPVVEDRLVGKTFAEKYEILEVIGRGGMSTVYKARHLLMNNLVAIKILNPSLVTDPSHLERFIQEARALSSLRHVNILQVYDSGIYENTQPYLVTEFLKGESLEEILEKHSNLPVERAVHIFLQICDGLQLAHKKNIIHRDLKTSNIVIVQEPDAKDVVKLLDFGIAKVLGDDPKAGQKLTKAGEVFGSPLYMSPEQCTSGEVDARSDIYSLGCVMYETLTGTPPHVGANALETMNKHVNEPVLSLRGIAPNLVIPELIDALVMKSLKKHPSQRQQTVEEVKKDLIEAAKRSRLYIESVSKAASYSTNPFEVEMPKQAPLEEPETEKQPAQPSKEMQQLVLDAVSLAEKQDKERKRLKNYLFGLYGLLAVGLIMGVSVLAWQGPKEDRGPIWQKLLWQWEINQGDDALGRKEYQSAEEHFKTAADMAKEFGDQGDRRIKSLLDLVKLYTVTGRKAEIAATKSQIADADCSRLTDEIKLVAGNGKGVAELRTSMDVEDLDPASARKYSEKFTAIARQLLAKGQLENAHRALEKAIAVEEYSKSENASSVRECAHELLGACKSEQHKKHSKVLIERAERLHI